MLHTNLNYQNVFNTIVDHLSEYIRTNNLKSCVLGISGGIDSTVVACICNKVSEVLKENQYQFKFYGYLMPTETTHDDEFNAAKLVGNAFCDACIIFDIDEIAKFINVRFNSRHVNTHKDKLKFGNIKSRLRAMYLYNQAQEHNGIVIGTDNYTEYLLGFSTIGGDALCDYAPIQYLWKTEVFGLAKYLMNNTPNELKQLAIQESINLIPQDGLGISNSDMDQIGAKNYFDVDEILSCFINEDFYLADDLRINIGDKVIKNVIDRHYKSEFKREIPITIERKYYE